MAIIKFELQMEDPELKDLMQQFINKLTQLQFTPQPAPVQYAVPSEPHIDTIQLTKESVVQTGKESEVQNKTTKNFNESLDEEEFLQNKKGKGFEDLSSL